MTHCIARAIIAEPVVWRLRKRSGVRTGLVQKARKWEHGGCDEGDAEGIACRGVHRPVGDGDGDEALDSFSITEYQRYWNESERQAYRRQVEFRELWPEYETPNELAQSDRRPTCASAVEAKRDQSTTELMTVPVLG